LDPRKKSFNLQRNFALTGADIRATVVRKRLIMGESNAIRLFKKLLLTDKTKKIYVGDKNHKKWTAGH